MDARQLKHLEDSLWKAADQLRANSKLTAAQYSQPVLGLIFLRHAYNRYAKVKILLDEENAKRNRPRPIDREDFVARKAMYLPDEAQFAYLASLPESADFGAAIDEAMRLIEVEYPALNGILPKGYGGFPKTVLVGLLRNFNSELLQKAEGDVFGKIYEYFLNKFAMSGAQEGGEFFTPTALVDLIVNVIEPDHGIVFDPACGSAGMFVQTAHFIEEEGENPLEKITIYGQEKTETNTHLAMMNLTVHGLEGQIRVGNTFYEDHHNLVGRCDFVMANPPFNVDGVEKGTDAVKSDPRLPLGLPKNDNANYLWIQYFYSYLNATGRAGFVMASSASDAGHSERLIRERLIDTGAVDVMVAVGNNFFYTLSLPCTLWFYDRAKQTDPERADRVLMLDARKIYRKVTQKINDFSPEQIKNLTAITWLYRGQNNRFAQLVDRYKNVRDATFELALYSHRMFIQNTEKLLAYCQQVTEAAKLDPLPADLHNPPLALAQLNEDTIERDAQAAGKAADAYAKALTDLTKRMADALKGNKAVNAASFRHKVKQQFEYLNHVLAGYTDELEAVAYYHHHYRWLTERFPDGTYRDVPGLCYVATRAEIAQRDYSLSPGRYVGVDNTPAEGAADLNKRLAAIHAELQTLTDEATQLAETVLKNYKTLEVV